MIKQNGERKLRGTGTAVTPRETSRRMVHDFEARVQIKHPASAVGHDAVNVLSLTIVDNFSSVHDFSLVYRIRMRHRSSSIKGVRIPNVTGRQNPSTLRVIHTDVS